MGMHDGKTKEGASQFYNMSMTQYEMALEQALNTAIEVHHANKQSRADAESTAYDAGRIDGLRQALELIEGGTK